MLHVRKEEDDIRGVHAEATRSGCGVPAGAARAALWCCSAWPSREALQAGPDGGEGGVHSRCSFFYFVTNSAYVYV